MKKKLSIGSLFPILENLKQYSKGLFRDDLIAGITVAVMLVPQGMAYAYLAGMPPIYGLYGGLIPILIYAIFGTSRQMSIGPVAVSALLVLAGISQIATPESPEYVSLVLLTGLLIGIIQIIMSVLRMGFLVNFLSHPIIAGFTSAAAVIIAVNQLKDLLGFTIPRAERTIDSLIYAIQHINETHLLTFVVGTLSIVIMVVLKKINRNIPGALIIVIISTIVTKVFGLHEMGLSIVQEVPKGLPEFYVPGFTLENIQLIYPTVLAVTIIGVVESIGIAKAMEAKHQNYQIRPNQELFALGISKVLGAFFQSLPTSGSFSRTAVNNESGAKTTVASIITALVIGLTLAFLTPYFFYLPKAVLAAIVMMAVTSLFAMDEAKHLWHIHRGDFWMLIITFISTLTFGIAEGVLIGVILSILSVLYLSSKPHLVILGNIPGTTGYRNVERFEDAIVRSDTLILRFDDQLYFGNATYFKNKILELVTKHPGIHNLILDSSSIHQIDSSGLDALNELVNSLEKKDIHLFMTGVIGPVRDRLYKCGLMNKIGMKQQFMYISDVIDCLDSSGDICWKQSAIQTNESQEKRKYQ